MPRTGTLIEEQIRSTHEPHVLEVGHDDHFLHYGQVLVDVIAAYDIERTIRKNVQSGPCVL